MIGESQVIVECHLCPQGIRCPAEQGLFETKVLRTLLYDRRLPQIPKRAMRRLRKRIDRLLNRPPSKITLRLRIVKVAPEIDLVSAGAE